MTGWAGHLLAPYTRKEVYYKDKKLWTSSVKHLPVSFWTDAKKLICMTLHISSKKATVAVSPAGCQSLTSSIIDGQSIP